MGAVLHLARIEAEANIQSRPHRRRVRSLAKALQSPFRFAFAAAAMALIVGCGQSYRPVVSAINPVGPAAQPQKFAVAISTTGAATANTTATFSSGASSITVSSVTGIVSGQLVRASLLVRQCLDLHQAPLSIFPYRPLLQSPTRLLPLPTPLPAWSPSSTSPATPFSSPPRLA